MRTLWHGIKAVAVAFYDLCDGTARGLAGAYDYLLGRGAQPTRIPGLYRSNWDGRYFIEPEEYLENLGVPTRDQPRSRAFSERDKFIWL